MALTDNTPKTIGEVIRIDRNITPHADINTAVFYSISSCQDGLSGISFGNFLIKEVAHKLKRNNEALEKFVTISPVPNLSKWHKEKSMDEDIDGDRLLKQAIIYLSDSDREDEFPNDPVARFHLGNGATLERVNLDADLSLKGIHQSKGIMVNYLYNLDSLERNHELFFKTKIVQQSDSIKSLRKKLQIQ